MTEVSGNPEIETLVDPLADSINTALVGFTGCIGEALEGICTYSLTIGEAYVPFDPDDGECEGEDEDPNCSQAYVRVVDIKVVYEDQGGFDHSPGPEGSDSCEGACGGTFNLDLEVGVIRCLEIPEDGEAPTATQVLAAAMQSMNDMSAIYQAAMNCTVWQSIDPGQWNPQGPLGGQYGGTWTFSVEL